jgi:hypothetical protein
VWAGVEGCGRGEGACCGRQTHAGTQAARCALPVCPRERRRERLDRVVGSPTRVLGPFLFLGGCHRGHYELTRVLPVDPGARSSRRIHSSILGALVNPVNIIAIPQNINGRVGLTRGTRSCRGSSFRSRRCEAIVASHRLIAESISREDMYSGAIWTEASFASHFAETRQTRAAVMASGACSGG